MSPQQLASWVALIILVVLLIVVLQQVITSA